jgi:hypothetical protein
MIKVEKKVGPIELQIWLVIAYSKRAFSSKKASFIRNLELNFHLIGITMEGALDEVNP